MSSSSEAVFYFIEDWSAAYVSEIPQMAVKHKKNQRKQVSSTGLDPFCKRSTTLPRIGRFFCLFFKVLAVRDPSEIHYVHDIITEFKEARHLISHFNFEAKKEKNYRGAPAYQQI